MRASCCVSVLPPCARRPSRRLFTAAPRIANEVDAGVIVEALILDRHDGANEVWRYAIERNLDALFAEDGERGLVVRVEERRRLGHRAHAAQRVRVGKTRQNVAGEPCGAAHGGPHERRERDHGAREEAVMSSNGSTNEV